MAIRMYDLAAAEGRRFSPFCWRTRMALAHKGLEVETVPLHFVEIPKVLGGRSRTVPAIEDGDRFIFDSWAIAEYLEEAYPNRGTLFGGAGGKGLALFVQNWTHATVHAAMFGFVARDIHDRLTPENRGYFRESREKRFGRTLEEVQAGREERLEPFRRSLAPLRTTLAAQPFLSGERPMYADYIVFGAFQWQRSVSPFALLEADDPVRAWFGRLLDMYDGLGRRSPGYD